MSDSQLDCVIVGGGLAGGLIALALYRARPEFRIAVIEAGRVIGIGTGLAKIEAILGALRGHLISEFITDEATAQAVLDA